MARIVKNIREYLIHALGGVTVSEASESAVNAYEIGEYIAMDSTRKHLESLNGLSAEEWCKKCWEYVVGQGKVSKEQ